MRGVFDCAFDDETVKRFAQNDGLFSDAFLGEVEGKNRQRQGRWSLVLERFGRLWRIKTFGILRSAQDDDLKQTTATATATNCNCDGKNNGNRQEQTTARTNNGNGKNEQG